MVRSPKTRSGNAGVARAVALLFAGVSSLALAPQPVKAQAKEDVAGPTAPTTNTQGGAVSRTTDPAVAGAPAPDTAQDVPAANPDTVAAQDEASGEVVVTGIRSSLANSQNIKRNADTVVDAVTAEDIGALPDRSVNEALQRVSGVSISRFAAGNDPDHFSVEGSGVVVRGLNYVRSEFNGRDTFSANGGRALNFQDVSPELLGSVEVFKNMTADQIEGGIAGTVNLNTRKPFDSREKQVAYLSVDMNYADLINKGAPAVSGLYARNFDTAAGRFGVMVGGSYSQLFSRADGIQISNYQQRFNGARDINGDGTAETDSFPGLAAGQVVYAPVGAGVRSQEFNRERIGAAAALQYQSNDESVLATLQFVRTDARQTWGEHTFETTSDGIDRQTFPAAGTRYTFDDDGLFQTGTITQDRGYTPPGGEQFGMITQLARRGVKTRSVTDDYGANLKWKATEHLSFNLDGQYVRSTSKQTDFSVYGSTFANVAVDLTDKIPQIEFLRPSGTGSNADYFGNPANSYYRAAMDHFEDNKGREYAFRADATYDFDDDSFLERIKVGARYADRDQTVRYSLYNWGVLSEVWAGSGPVHFADTGSSGYEGYSFDDVFRGDGPTSTRAPFVRGNPATDYTAAAALAQAVNAQWVALGGVPGWTPAASRAGVVAGTNFLPNEVYSNVERTKAAYARVDFGTDGTDLLGGLRLSGNVGLRYVQTLDKAEGFFTFPNRSQIIGQSASAAAFCADPSQTSSFCQLTAAQQTAVLTFSDGTAINQTNRNKFDHWLPSFNLKLGITPRLITRFAYSKAISRPGFEQLQSTTQIQPAAGVTPFRLDGGSRNANPNLRPVEANQFDLTAEWYFARVGSLTAAVFYKDLTNIVVANVPQVRSVTNNGITQDVTFIGPQNADGKGRIKGFELAYQQTFDFLPGALSGLGVQANYTYVDPSKIPNTRGALTSSTTTTIDIGSLPLENLSKHTVNAAVFYERGPISLRAAYNWRSKFLLTVRDEIVPNLPIMSASYGQLDGSMLYSVNDHFKIGIQAQNLTDTTTRTRSIINADGQTAPRTYFKNDRRFSLTTRMKF